MSPLAVSFIFSSNSHFVCWHWFAEVHCMCVHMPHLLLRTLIHSIKLMKSPCLEIKIWKNYKVYIKVLSCLYVQISVLWMAKVTVSLIHFFISCLFAYHFILANVSFSSSSSSNFWSFCLFNTALSGTFTSSNNIADTSEWFFFCTKHIESQSHGVVSIWAQSRLSPYSLEFGIPELLSSKASYLLNLLILTS